MSMELLAVTRADAPSPPELRRVALAGLAALAVERSVPDAERLRLLRDAMAAAPVLPVRRGASGDAAALAAFLATHAPALQAGLRKVNGCVEVIVSVEVSAAAANPIATIAGAGRGYLRARAADQAAQSAAETRASALALEALASVRGLAKDTVVRGYAKPGGLSGADGCALVPNARCEEALSALRLAGGRHRDALVRVSGPWPAYSFADLALARAAA